MYNEDTTQGKWKQLKGEIQKAWGNITGDELDQTKGDLKSIAGIVQEKYGTTKEDASLKLSEISERLVAGVAEKTKEAFQSAKNADDKKREQKRQN